MVRLYLLLFLVEVVLAVAALISCLSADEGDIRALPRIVWVLVILFFPLIGAVAWFAVGRPVTVGAPRPVWRPGTGFSEAERPRPVAPDDDPEFLRSLRSQQQRDDTDLLKRWEADLRRREEELRRQRDQRQDPEH